MRFAAALLILLLAALVCLLPTRAAWSDCQPLTIGVDTSKATSATATVLGDVVGEVFYAPDTLVSSVTIWRSSFIDSSTVGLKIYVANVDSLGRPNPQSLILDGPTVYHVLGDSIRPTPFQFVFNPPLVLPHPGKYEFAFQASPCAASFYFIYANNNPFAEGTLWWHGQTAQSLCRLRTDPTEYAIQDLVFQIDFCQPTVPARRETWGHLKGLYH